MASSDPTSGGDGERDVFGSLPNTRPQRRSTKRDRTGGAAKAASAAPSRAKSAKPRSAKPRTSAKAEPAATPIPPSGYATPRADDGVPTGAHLVTTAVQAAGELAHIGLSAGGRALKSALGRLPRP
jgi:hypothetical protein